MKEKMSVSKFNGVKNEKGSVTLFVSIAMLFFLMVAIVIFVGNRNKQMAQIKEIERIAQIYNNQGEINQIYDDTLEKAHLDITFEPNGQEYVIGEDINSVTAETTIKVGDSSGELKNLQYGWSDSKTKAPTSWTRFSGTEKTTSTELEIVEEAYLWVKGEKSNGNLALAISERFYGKDGRAPKINLDPNGGSVNIQEETTKIVATPEIIDDSEVEVKYVWSTDNVTKPDESLWTTLPSGETTMVSPDYGTGEYYLWIKATDSAGNVTEFISEKYTIRVMLPPTVSLKYNSSEGEEYVSGTWTNQDVYGEITVPESEGEVKYYQYSDDKIKWGIIPGSESYTTTFPMNEEGKPSWIGNVTPNGTYYFDIDETTGTLTSAGEHGNKGISSSKANSYIPINLEHLPSQAEVKVTLNYTVSSESVSYDVGYAIITQSVDAPLHTDTENRFVRAGGSTTTGEGYIIIEGGEQYYLHLGYRKDGSVNKNDDCFIINSLTIEVGSYFSEYNKNGNTISYKITKDVNDEVYVRAVYEDGSKSVETQFKVAIDKINPVIKTATSVYTEKGEITIEVTEIEETGSGVRGYYVSTEQTAPTIESEWVSVSSNTFVIDNLEVSPQYYVWVIDNTNNISQVKSLNGPAYRIDNVKYAGTLQEAVGVAKDKSVIELLRSFSDTSVVTIDKNITIDTGEYVLSRNTGIEVKATASESLTIEVHGKIQGSPTIFTTSGTVIFTGTGIINSYRRFFKS